MKKSVLWTMIFIAVVGSVGGLVFWDYTDYIDNPISFREERNIRVVVKQDSTLTQVLSLLEEKEIILRPVYFRAFLMVNELDGKLKAGVYLISTKKTPRDVAVLLTRGPQTAYMVLTVKEGFNIWQVAQAMEEAGIATEEEVLTLLKDPEFAQKLGVPKGAGSERAISLLEGFVFPETYFVAPGQKLESIIERMVKQCRKEIEAAKRSHLVRYSIMREQMGFSDHELVTLASLVERETALPHEKKLVASVFINRLRKQMPLQTDPSLTYDEEKRGGKPTAADRKNEANPYNTYAHKGLPPGPICNPGRESLAAVAAPARTGFLYFVSRNDGTGGHHFSVDYEEHKRAVKQFLKGEEQ
jgi:UPF0755 protein